MKKTYIAAVAAAIFMANIGNANAQSNLTYQEEQVVNRLTEKATTWKLSEGQKEKTDAISMASAKTYFYDCGKFEVESPFNEKDSLVSVWQEWQIRNETSGVAGGVDIGGLMLDKNFTVAVGGHLTMAWKRFDLTGGFLIGSNKHTDESSLAGKSFITTMVYGEAAVPFRFKQGGYNNMAYIAPFIGYACIFDKNQDYLGENKYTTDEGTVTETSFFDVEGKSAALYGGFKYRTSLKHGGVWGLTVKVFGGVYNRYFKDGSKRKPFFGATVGLEFSGAKKRVDSDVQRMHNDLANGDYRIANAVINNLRAASMK